MRRAVAAASGPPGRQTVSDYKRNPNDGPVGDESQRKRARHGHTHGPEFGRRELVCRTAG